MTSLSVTAQHVIFLTKQISIQWKIQDICSFSLMHIYNGAPCRWPLFYYWISISKSTFLQLSFTSELPLALQIKVNRGKHLDQWLINCQGQNKNSSVFRGVSFPNKGGDSMLSLECTAPYVMSYFSCLKPQFSKQMENLLWLAVKSLIRTWELASPHTVYEWRSCLCYTLLSRQSNVFWTLYFL